MIVDYFFVMRELPIESNYYYHIYNRGVSRQTIFHEDPDYKRFMVNLYRLSLAHKISVNAYCLMPNHFHMMAIDKDNSVCAIPKFMHALQMSYAKFYNHKYDHSGAVFQGRYQAKLVECEESETKIKYYILNNPVEAGLVSHHKDWLYSGC